eukprot:NODE_18145_length_908_cov_2.786172.p2 GENE.NODE_18145_length_908_cov_2.786172~~NODE_18145_length_908_cov_2.786172.p2  ORF type:complete len:179 (-),score=85.67 NODE_18145_length_908_cov_2.786172:195-731(-)
MRSAEEVATYLRPRLPSLCFGAAELVAINKAAGVAVAEPHVPAAVASPQPPPPLPAAAHMPPPDGKGAAAPKHHIEQLCADFRKRDKRGADAALMTVRKALTHVIEEPRELKFRRLKASNPRVQSELLAHTEAVTLLRFAGFVRHDNGDLELPPPAPLTAVHNVLEHLPPADGAKSVA